MFIYRLPYLFVFYLWSELLLACVFLLRLILLLLCLQAGMLAVRENRYIVLAKDFEKAYKTVIKKDEQEHEFYK